MHFEGELFVGQELTMDSTMVPERDKDQEDSDEDSDKEEEEEEEDVE